MSFTPSHTDKKWLSVDSKTKVAMIREVGNNGDREISTTLYAAGFEPWDVMMSNLLQGSISLHEFHGIVF